MEVPVRVVKITSNDHQELIYLPRRLRRLGFVKGRHVLLKVDAEKRRLILELLPEVTGIMEGVARDAGARL